MKNLLIVAFATCSLLGFSQVKENVSSTPRAIIKISPFQFLSQTLEVSIESLNSDYSKAFEINGALRSGHYDYDQGRGGTLGIAYRKYVRPLATPTRRNPDASQGVYYSLFVKGQYFAGRDAYYWQSPNTSRIDESITTLNPGFTIGLQRTLFEVLYLDMFIGGGIKFTNVKYSAAIPGFTFMEYDVLHPAYEGIHPVAGVKIGVGL
jgi:hypothetical protein